MSQQHLNFGSQPDALAHGGTPGDTLDAAMIKVEANFNELYSMDGLGVNAGSPQFAGSGTTVQIINAAAAFALANGKKYVVIPIAFLPYDHVGLVIDPSIQLVTEGNAYVLGTYDARAYGGGNATTGAWGAMGLIVSLLPTTGGIIDARGYVGAQIANGDLFFNINRDMPVRFIFGPATYTNMGVGGQVIGAFVGENVVIELNGTMFTFNDPTTQSVMWSSASSSSSNVTVTNGSAVITIQNTLTRGIIPKVGKVIGIHGHIPNFGARDNTTLNGAIDNVQTSSITLTSTVGQASTNGSLRIDNEIITYTSFSGNVLVGATRGAFGSTAASHSNLAAVDRVVYDSYKIAEVTGAGPWTVTLDRTITQAPNMSSAPVQIGPSNCAIVGTGILDGARPLAGTLDGVNLVNINGEGSEIYFASRFYVGPGIEVRNFDHAGMFFVHGHDCVVDGLYHNIGTVTVAGGGPLGFSVVFFSGCRNCVALGDYYNVPNGPVSDDRTNQATNYDNGSVGCIFLPRTIKYVVNGVHFEGTQNSTAFAPVVDTYSFGTAGFAGAISGPQWVTNPTVSGNTIRLGAVSPAGTGLSLASNAQGNYIYCDTPGVTIAGSGGNNYVQIAPTAFVNGTLTDYYLGFGGGFRVRFADEIVLAKTYTVATGTQNQVSLNQSEFAIADTGGFKIGDETQIKASHTSGTQSNIVAYRGFFWGAGNGGTTAAAYCFYADGEVDTGAVVTTLSGFRFAGPGGAGAAAVVKGLDIGAFSSGTTNNIGVDIGAITGTGAFAIRTNQGTVAIGGQITLQQVTGTQSAMVLLSPDGGTQTNIWAINGNVSAVGAMGNYAFGVRVNNLLRWSVDTSGRIVPDTTNGGAQLERSIALVSGTTPALDASQGNNYTLTITSNIAVVIAVPTNAPAAGLSQEIEITLRNGSGGALTTAPTFNTGAGGFKFSAVTNPANGTQVVYRFKWDPVQSFWYEVGTHQAAGL